MIISFLLQAADTVLKVHSFPFCLLSSFNRVLRFHHLHDCSMIYLEDSFSLYAGSNIPGCCSKAEGRPVDCFYFSLCLFV